MFLRAYSFDQDLGGWRVSSLGPGNTAGAGYMFDDVALSTENYEALLIGWNSQALQQRVQFNGGDSTFCGAAAEAARANMISTYRWVISDGGKRCPAPEIDVQRPPGTSIWDGDDDELGIRDAGPIQLTYTIDNSAGTAPLTVTGVTASNTVNCSGFSVATPLPLNVAAGGAATLEVSFNVDGSGDFSLDMDIASNDADENPYDITISGRGVIVNPTDPEDDFLITVKTDNPGDQWNTRFYIPASGPNLNYNVDCDNDGTDEYVELRQGQACIYPAPGIYTIRIRDNSGGGTGFSGVYFGSQYHNPLKLLAVEQWGSGKWSDMRDAFRGCENMTVTATDVPDLSGVTDMYRMFLGASSLNGDIGGWDTSNVTIMGAMFKGASVFNEDISGWDTSSVTYMAEMFRDASAFDQDIGGWDVTSLTNAEAMFSGAALSTANYDALLIGWNSQPLQSGVKFDAGNSTYCQGEVARDNMINTFGWAITDGGKLCAEPTPTVTPTATRTPSVTPTPEHMRTYLPVILLQ
jgi:surface protein